MKKSYIIAGILALALTGWVLGGYYMKASETKVADAPAVADSAPPMTVSVRTEEAQPVSQVIIAQGQAEPNRTVIVRAETMGRVVDLMADEGSLVKTGDVLVRLEENDRQARIDHAEARLRELQSAYDAAHKLGKKGYQTQRQSDQLFSSLQSAKAELEKALIEFDRLEITAPFDGTVLSTPVELGAYIDTNGEVATIVDNNPLVAHVEIMQQKVAGLKVGQPASVKFATGQEREGKIRYIAPRADERTRTFRVEIELDNPGDEIPSGISVEAKIPTGSIVAHYVSPASLSLNSAGKLGVKTVGNDDRVVFNEASIVTSDANGAWVTGLPEKARIITLGQGYVRVGERVKVAEEDTNVGMADTKTTSSHLTTGSTKKPTAAQ